jgi:transcriptional regulator with XRE-family HTH domain
MVRDCQPLLTLALPFVILSPRVDMDIREMLRAEMGARGWNARRLARACRVAPALAYRWVTDDDDDRVNPGPASCQKIADGLGVDLDYVLSIAGHRPASKAEGRARLMGIDRELQRRMERLNALVRAGYPRATLLAVLDANIRMAEMGQPTSSGADADPRPEAPAREPIPNPTDESAPKPRPSRLGPDQNGPDRGLTPSFASPRAPALAGVHC